MSRFDTYANSKIMIQYYCDTPGHVRLKKKLLKMLNFILQCGYKLIIQNYFR